MKKLLVTTAAVSLILANSAEARNRYLQRPDLPTVEVNLTALKYLDDGYNNSYSMSGETGSPDKPIIDSVRPKPQKEPTPKPIAKQVLPSPPLAPITSPQPKIMDKAAQIPTPPKPAMTPPTPPAFLSKELPKMEVAPPAPKSVEKEFIIPDLPEPPKSAEAKPSASSFGIEVKDPTPSKPALPKPVAPAKPIMPPKAEPKKSLEIPNLPKAPKLPEPPAEPKEIEKKPEATPIIEMKDATPPVLKEPAKAAPQPVMPAPAIELPKVEVPPLPKSPPKAEEKNDLQMPPPPPIPGAKTSENDEIVLPAPIFEDEKPTNNKHSNDSSANALPSLDDLFPNDSNNTVNNKTSDRMELPKLPTADMPKPEENDMGSIEIPKMPPAVPPAPPAKAEEEIKVGKPEIETVMLKENSIPKLDNVTAGSASGTSLSVPFGEAEVDFPLSEQANLLEIVEKMKADDSLVLTVKAYASGTAEQASQAKRTSLARALSVRKFFLEREIDSERMIIKPLGNKAVGGVPDRIDVFLDKKGSQG